MAVALERRLQAWSSTQNLTTPLRVLVPTSVGVRPQTDVKLGEFGCETQAFGLATTRGVVPTVGMSGLSLGGGLGQLHGRDRLPDGESVFGIAACYCGAVADGEKILKPLRTFGSPLADALSPMVYERVLRIVKRNLQWTREYWEAMRRYLVAGAYGNYVTDEGESIAREAYGANYDRLAALKSKYDPTNFFRMNHSIRPSPTTESVELVHR